MNFVKMSGTDTVDLFFSTEKLPNDDREHRSAGITKFIMSKNMKRPIITGFLIIICAIIFGGMYLIVVATSESSTFKQQQSRSNKTTESITRVETFIIERNHWGTTSSNNRSLNLEHLIHPTKLVIISHTATQTCDNFEKCAKLLSSIHTYHTTTRGKDDIGYNFLIGGDGKVYEGRGWDFVNMMRNNSLSICFVGNFVMADLNSNMADAAEKLIEEGVKLGKLDKDYKVVCHNQTMATQSPGINVYKVVEKWKHFSDEILY